TYSVWSTSVMPARTMRMPAASEAKSSVSTGRTSCDGLSSGFPPGGTIATGGSQSSATKNTPIRSDPVTNSGRAMAPSERIEMAWSIALPGKIGPITPSPIESGIMKSAAIAARIAEFFSGPEIWCQTDSCWPWARLTADTPRSPWTKPSSQSAYRVVAGRSSCIRFVSTASACGVALRPRMTLAGSPGRMFSAAKMTIDATNSATNAPRRRRPRNASTGDISRRTVRGSAAAVTGRLRSSSRREPRVHEEVVAERAGGVRLETLHLLRHRVHPVGVRPLQVAALVVLDLLHLVPVVLRLRLVELADRVRERGVERRRLEVRLVVRRARRECLQVEVLQREHRPLGLGEGHLQVEQARVVVGVGRLLLQVHRHAGGLRLLGEERGRLDEAGEDVRGLELDLQIRLAGGLEQALGLVDVLHPLRQRGVVIGQPLADGVVADGAEAGDRALDEGGAVGDQAEGLPHPV